MCSHEAADFTLRLEPIIDFNTGGIVGFEALSAAKCIKANNLTSPNALSINGAGIIAEQLSSFQKRHFQDKETYKRVFIKIDCEFLKKEALWAEFIPYSLQFPISVEVDVRGASQFVRGDYPLNLARLSNLGVEFWFDGVEDFFEIHHHDFMPYLTGVRFDRLLFRASPLESERYRLIRFLSLFKRKYSMPANDIELISLTTFAIEHGFDFGQTGMSGDEKYQAVLTLQPIYHLHQSS